MKFPSFFIFVSTVLSSASILDASNFESESQINLADLVNKDSEKLNVWLLGKKSEIEQSTSSESLLSSDVTTISTDSSEQEKSPTISEISTPSTPLSVFDSPSTSAKARELSEHDHLIEFSHAIRSKEYKSAVNHLNSISNWKMTIKGTNISVFSIICKYAKSKFLGKVNHPRALEMFSPLLEGKHKNMAGGYLAALSLFRPEFQNQIMSRLIRSAPNLRGLLLLSSIYYRLDESVIEMLLNSGALINFDKQNEYNSLRGIPSLCQKSSSPQFAVNERFFMNFNEPFNFQFEWGRGASPDPEVNFLLGMMGDCVPDEVGALRVAFENYSPEIVLALVDLCPIPAMTNYHLAHLIAKNGPTPNMSAYPKIENLVDVRIIFDNLMKGNADLVDLALLPTLSPQDQNDVIDEFLRRTTIFTTRNLHNPTTIVSSTSRDFKTNIGIYEFPSSPAHVFLLTACKWNIDDLAFEKIFKASKRIANRQFWIAKSAALEWAKKNNLSRKAEILA